MAVQCSCNTNETFLDLKKKRALQSNFNSNSLLPIFVIDNKFLNFSKPFFIQKTEILPPLWDGSIYKIMYINSLDQVLAYKNHRVILSFLPFLFPYGFSIKTTTKQEYLIFTYIIFLTSNPYTNTLSKFERLTLVFMILIIILKKLQSQDVILLI